MNPSRFLRVIVVFCSLLSGSAPAFGEDKPRASAKKEPSAAQAAAVKVEVDHVTVAGSDLTRMRDAFAAIGLKSEYGGAHSNGITHMALIGFDDGSYIELVSTMKPDQTNIPIWKKLILEDGGPAGWAARSADVAAEAKRVGDLGVTVQGPFPGGRTRPDGKEARWKLAFLGDQQIGAVLPFLIEDVSPRENRVRPTEGVAGGELTGVAAVVIGVEESGEAIRQFRRVYQWPAPRVMEDSAFGAKLAWFEDTPVILATPPADGGWLSRRMTRFGEAPIAILLKPKDFKAGCKRYDLDPNTTLFGRRVAWFDPAKLGGTRLGLIASDAEP